jgi:hypothetical protein
VVGLMKMKLELLVMALLNFPQHFLWQWMT